MTAEDDRRIEELLVQFNDAIDEDMQMLGNMQREFGDLMERSPEGSNERRFADAIAALTLMLERTMGVAQILANSVFDDRMRRIRERERRRGNH